MHARGRQDEATGESRTPVMVTDDSHDDSPRPKESRAPLDPILTLQLGGEDGTPSVLGQQSLSLSCSVTSVCFVAGRSSFTQESSYSVDPNETEGFSDDDSSDDSFPLQLRSRKLVQSESRSSVDPTSAARSSAATLSASGRFLASCQTNGESFLWEVPHASFFTKPRTWLVVTAIRGRKLCFTYSVSVTR